MDAERKRKTNLLWSRQLTREFHLQPAAAGNGVNTVTYLQWLRSLYPDKRLLLLWDGASYHRDAQCKAFLAEVNQGREEKDWLVTCLGFAPNAPEQNPVEDIWLAGKNLLRRKFAENKTFAAVKESFFNFLKSFKLESVKFDWYLPYPQLT